MEPRRELYAALDKYLGALQEGSEKAFREARSRVSLAQMDNLFRAMGREISEAIIHLREDSEEWPDLKDARATVLEEGPTAGLFLAREAPDAPGTTECHLLRFVHEDGAWRLDENAVVYTEEHSPDTVRYEDVVDEIPETARIDGRTRDMPEPAPEPGLPAGITAMSYGYETRVSIDGEERPPIRDGSSSGGILGGLEEGKHTIEIAAEPCGDPGPLWIRIDVGSGDDARTVLEWKPEGGGPHHFTGGFEI